MSEPLDNFLLRAYLDGEMDEATAQAFEIRMIGEPDLADLVDASYALSAGLRLAGVSLQAAAPAPAAAEAVALPSAQPRADARRFGRVVPWLAAAGVVLATGIGVGRMSQPTRALFEPVTLVSIDKNRSTVAQAMSVPVPASGTAVLLVPVVSSEPCQARLEIHQGGAILTAEAAYNGDSSTPLNLAVDAARLATGRADVMVGCVGRKPVKYEMNFTR